MTIHLKQWVAEEAERSGVSWHGVYDRLRRSKRNWYPHVTARVLPNKTVVVDVHGDPPGPIGIPLRTWLNSRSLSDKISPHAIYSRLIRKPEQYYPNVHLTRVNKRVVFVTERGAV